MLSKLYTDIGEVFSALELASLNKLTVSLLPSKKLIYIYFAGHFNLFRTRFRVDSPIETRVYVCTFEPLALNGTAAGNSNLKPTPFYWSVLHFNLEPRGECWGRVGSVW